MRLKGKTAIITGAGRGLGRASAIAMAREGAAVVLISRTNEELKETAATILASGGRAIPLPGDVADPQLPVKAADAAMEIFGTIDILVNNAAVVSPLKPLWQVAPAEWEASMNINLKGAQMFCHAVVPKMILQKSGKIINITSGLGSFALPPFGLYSIAKAGLNHMTRIMAEELRGHHIQVNGLDPGVMDTRMQEEIRGSGSELLGERIYQNFQSMKDRGSLTPTEQVAQLVVFLASPAADRLTGEIGGASHFAALGFK